jgi:hypothetical protein
MYIIAAVKISKCKVKKLFLKIVFLDLTVTFESACLSAFMWCRVLSVGEGNRRDLKGKGK